MKNHFCISLSFESGQDVSSRFGPQQTGGTIIQHVRPVDLQASMVQAGEIMARWTTLLADVREIGNDASYFTVEAKEWQKVVHNFTVKTRSMWQDGWFRDYDSVAGEWSTQQDAMHLAPIFCGASDWDHVEQLREALAHPPAHSSGWAPLSWPPVVMTLVGAASAASMPAEATELAYRYIDGSYRSADSRQPDEEGGLPGVTRKYRRVIGVEGDGTYTYANGGIEGYGWGALSIHLLLRYLLGMRKEEAGIVTVAPMLPQALRRPGSVYHVEPIHWGIYTLAIECRVGDGSGNARGYIVRLKCTKQEKSSEDTKLPLNTFEYEWQGKWGEERKLSLP